MRTLKSKIALVTTSIFVVLVALISAFDTTAVKDGVREQAGAEQLSFTAAKAAEIEKKIALVQRALTEVAAQLPARLLSQPAALQRYLDDQTALKSLFGDLVIYDQSLKAIAEYPVRGRIGDSYADAPHLRDTLSTGAPQISAPQSGRKFGRPIVIFTAPVRNTAGSVVGALGGTIELLGENFLGDMATERIGNSGSFALLGHDRTLIISQDRERVLSRGPLPGVSAYFDKAVAGQDGWDETTDSRGLHAVFAYSSLHRVPWTVVTALPVDQAFGAVGRAQSHMRFLSLIIAACLLPALWFVCYRERTESERNLQASEARARDAEQRLNRGLEGAGMAFWDWQTPGERIYLSPQWAAMLGYPLEEKWMTLAELLGHTHPNDREHLRDRTIGMLKGDEPYVRVEHRVRRFDGEWLWMLTQGRAIERGPDGRATRVCGIDADITLRKRMEESVRENERRLHLITENTPALISYTDAAERVQFYNRTYELWHRKPRTEAYGRTLSEVLGADHYALIASYVRLALNGETVHFQRELFTGGRGRFVDIHYVPDKDETGRVLGFYALLNDISDLKHAESTLRESEARFRAMSDCAPIGMFVTDTAGRCTYTNDMYRRISGLTQIQAEGEGWKRAIHKEDLPALMRAWAHAVEEGRKFAHDTRFVRPDGRTAWTSVHAATFEAGGGTLGYVGVVEDVTDKRRATEYLSYQAHHDALTGLANRTLLKRNLYDALARMRRGGKILAVMYLDVDHFKSINDRLGHAAGDELLKAFAGRLSLSVRTTDTVARFGGDEFVILLEGLNEISQAGVVGRKILAAVEPSFYLLGERVFLTTSIGAAVIEPDSELNQESILRHADDLLYKAKRAGRNRIHWEVVKSPHDGEPAQPAAAVTVIPFKG